MIVQVHMAFTLSETAASVTILGASGALGASLMDQLRVTQEQLASNLGVRFNVVQVMAFFCLNLTCSLHVTDFY